jgi:hypothetical protein
MKAQKKAAEERPTKKRYSLKSQHGRGKGVETERRGKGL